MRGTNDEIRYPTSFKGCVCDVLGMGISNRPLIDLLLADGAIVRVRDKKTPDALGEDAGSLAKRGVTFVSGEGYLDRLDGDYIFRSPGIRPDLPQIRAAEKNGSVLTCEMEQFLARCPCPVIGITGSDGKTTTTTVTHLLLAAEAQRRQNGQKIYLGGNIGTPLLPRLAEMKPDDFAVAELSSFQLQRMAYGVSRAVITNITPNHLNWHTDMEEYTDAKKQIYRTEPCNMLVTNRDNPVCASLAAVCTVPLTLFSSTKDNYADITAGMPEGCCAVFIRDGYLWHSDGQTETKIIPVSAIRLPGRHNVENYMAAIGVTWGLVSCESIDTVARTFAGVTHRLEFIRKLNGVTYYNSSIDSTPTRTAAALHALQEKPIVICGGYDKHIPFAPLAEVLCERAKAVVLTGATADAIMSALRECPAYREDCLPVFREDTFGAAVDRARAIATDGDTVLLSPACASFDAFRNFEERGDTFRRLVMAFTE